MPPHSSVCQRAAGSHSQLEWHLEHFQGANLTHSKPVVPVSLPRDVASQLRGPVPCTPRKRVISRPGVPGCSAHAFSQLATTKIHCQGRDSHVVSRCGFGLTADVRASGRGATLDNIDAGAVQDDFEGTSADWLASKRAAGRQSSSQKPSPQRASTSRAEKADGSSATATSVPRPSPSSTEQKTAHSAASAAGTGWPQQQGQRVQDDWGDWGWPEATASSSSAGTASSSSGPAVAEGNTAAAYMASDTEAPYIMEPSEVESASEPPDLTELSQEELVCSPAVKCSDSLCAAFPFPSFVSNMAEIVVRPQQ